MSQELEFMRTVRNSLNLPIVARNKAAPADRQEPLVTLEQVMMIGIPVFREKDGFGSYEIVNGRVEFVAASRPA